MRKLTFLCAALIGVTLHLYSQVDFHTLSPGDILADQLVGEGVRFIPYSNSIKGRVASTPEGNIAEFDYCLGCEFFPSVANIVFTNEHKTVTVHLGLVLGPQISVNREIHVDAFDAAGTLVASQPLIITSGTGFNYAMTVTSATTNIASLVIHPINDPAANADIGIKDILFDDSPATPDFLLQGLISEEVVAGSSVDYAITILRLGNFAGNVSFTVAGLPQGVTAAFRSGGTNTEEVLQLTAAADAPETMVTITIIGSPSFVSSFPNLRTLTVTLKVSQAFKIFSVPNIDLATCNQQGPTGTLSIPVTVIRQGQVKGPVTLSLEGLPSNITANFSPSILNFPGYATGDKSNLTFTVDGGVTFPDGLVNIRATNGTFSSVFTFDLHGTCPRNNKDFTIKGSFFSNHFGLIRPIKGAVVEIWRDVPYWFDDKVSETKTDENGAFEAHLWADDEDTYYAKLKLNDETGVYLHGSWTLDIWDANSVNRGSNSDPVIDVGSTLISVDDGGSTPKASIWQGSHNAYQEYISTTGIAPPTGDYEIRVWEGFISPYTYLSTTEWPDNFPTNIRFSGQDTRPKGIDDFFDYSTSFHEFGHAVRHSFDGDFNHFTWDATRFYYGRSHGVCDKNNDGFAFNEGWAEFWAKEPKFSGSCSADGTPDFEREFDVAIDLTNLMTCTGKSRKDMVQFLGSRRDFIHSDADFRDQFKQFFGIDLTGCPPSGKLTAAAKASALTTQSVIFFKIDSVKAIETLQASIYRQGEMITSFQSELSKAVKKSEEIKSSAGRGLSAKDASLQMANPIRIQGQIKLMQLVQTNFQTQLDSMKKGKFRSPDYSPEFQTDALLNEYSFDNKAKQIAITTFEQSRSAIAVYISKDTSGEVQRMVADLDRKLRLLKANAVGGMDVFAMLKISPAAWSNEVATEYRSTKTRWWPWAIIVISVIIIAGIWFWIRSRRKRNQSS